MAQAGIGLRAATLAGVCAAGLMMSACSVISSKSSVTVSGTPVTQYTLNQLECGQTTEAQVLDLLGPPTRIMTDDSRQTMVYEYSKHHSGRGSLLFVFRGASEKVTRRTAYIELDRGLVTRSWIDEG